jgi:hypothetical protein
MNSLAFARISPPAYAGIEAGMIGTPVISETV